MRKCALISIMLMLVLLCGMASAETAVDWMIDSRTTQSFTDEAIPDEDLQAILEAGLAATSAINQQPWFFVAVTSQEAMNEIKGSSGGFGGAPAGGFGDAPAGGMPEGAPAGDMPEGAPAGDMPEGERPTPPQGGGMPGGSAKAGLGDSPVAIIIYMDEGSKSPNASFDCGLATQNMFLAAKALGYGAKIVSSPTMQLNGANHDALCEMLGVDKAYTAVAVLLIGREAETVDATSSASVRSGVDEKVSFVQ